jgi:hypothetical protein
MLLADAKRRITERMAPPTTPEEAAIGVAATLPTLPSPDYLAKAGAAGSANFDLLSKFQQLFDDAMLLRDFASKTDAAGETSIKNPLFFDRSIGLRDRLINTALHTFQAIWDMRRQQEFFDILVAEVAAESPEVAACIIVRLRDASERYGMTFDTRV